MRSSSTLTAKQLRELEGELRRERARLERALQATNGTDVGNREFPSGASAGYTPGSQDAAIGIMLESRTQARYDAVMAALARLETATYGSCAACAKPIPFGRLVVMPEVTHCVRCGVLE